MSRKTNQQQVAAAATKTKQKQKMTISSLTLPFCLSLSVYSLSVSVYSTLSFYTHTTCLSTSEYKIKERFVSLSLYDFDLTFGRESFFFYVRFYLLRRGLPSFFLPLLFFRWLLPCAALLGLSLPRTLAIALL